MKIKPFSFWWGTQETNRPFQTDPPRGDCPGEGKDRDLSRGIHYLKKRGGDWGKESWLLEQMSVRMWGTVILRAPRRRLHTRREPRSGRNFYNSLWKEKRTPENFRTCWEERREE